MIANPLQCDALVVGAGPGGSACARRLRQHGVSVGLIEKSQFPRDKVCAGWITPQVLEELTIDPAEYADGRVLQPITGFQVGMIDRPGRIVDYGSVVSYAIRRCEFDEFLVRRTGVAVREGEPVHSIKRRPDGWLVNHDIHARLLIGAGGHFCPVARWHRDKAPDGGTNRDRVPVIAAQEVEFELSDHDLRRCRVSPSVPELYFYPDLEGYAWCVRKGRFINIGLGRIGERNLQTYRESFIRGLVASGRIGRPPEQPFRGHAYRLNVMRPEHQSGDHLILIGDAAGLAGARSGEGIRPAIESGLIAADVVAQADGDYSMTSLRSYDDRLAERLVPGRKITGAASVVRHMLGKWLLSNRWFVRRFVLDDWFLNRTLPAWKGTMHAPDDQHGNLSDRTGITGATGIR